jgi:hypothetical protein
MNLLMEVRGRRGTTGFEAVQQTAYMAVPFRSLRVRVLRVFRVKQFGPPENAGYEAGGN